ncbi:MAG TPA: hypothetical protein PK530_07925 [Anaerolineales bacterium]|nr:hypothetical protein [Anaerolineales bacterium]
MKGRILHLLIVCILGLCIFEVAYAATSFSENFDSLIPGTSITTSNTNFTYVRIGSGGGTITAESAVSGEPYMRLGGSTITSLNGVGIQSTLGNLNLLTLNFRLNLEDTNGDLFIGAGNGTMFTSNVIFVTTQLMFGIESNNGNLDYRTTGWNSTGQTLTPGVNYDFHIVVNRSGSAVNYGSYSVANGTMDLFIDGVLVGDNLPIANNQNATGFRIYQVDGGHYARIDSITIDDTALPPFAPTALTLTHFTAKDLPHLWINVLLALALLGLSCLLWLGQRLHRN